MLIPNSSQKKETISTQSVVGSDPFDEAFAALDELMRSIGPSEDRYWPSPDSPETVIADFDFEERVTKVDEISAKHLDEYLEAGWIHSGEYFKRRPFIRGRTKTFLNIPIRIRLKDFRLSKSLRRVLRRNRDTQTVVSKHCIVQEDLELFDKHKVRFRVTPPGSLLEVVPRKSDTEIMKFSVLADGVSVAVSFLDVGPNSTYSIYGMFEPSIRARSLGILTILREIEYSINQGKEFYYLGFVVQFQSMYDYKKSFCGTEFFDWKDGWRKGIVISDTSTEKRDFDPGFTLAAGETAT